MWLSGFKFDSITANEGCRVAHHSFYIFLAHREDNDRDGGFFLSHEIIDSLFSFLPRTGNNIGKRFSFQRMIVFRCCDQDIGGIYISILSQYRRQHGTRGRVRVLVGGHVHATLPSLFDELDRVGDAAPIRLAVGFVMGNLDSSARSLPYLDCLRHRLGQFCALISDVRGIDAVVLGDNPGKLYEFRRLRKRAWGIDQACGHAYSAVLHSLANQFLHAIEFVGIRLAAFHSHGIHTHDTMRNIISGIDRNALFFKHAEVVGDSV